MPEMASNLLPSLIPGAFREDQTPSPDCVGKRVYWVAESERHYGTITEIRGKHVTLRLEKRWNHRIKLTMNWMYLRIAADQNIPQPAARASADAGRIDALRKSVVEATRKSPHHIAHYNEIDAHQMAVTCMATHQTLQEYLKNYELMRITIHDLAKELNQQYDQCISYGVDPSRLPPKVETLREYEIRPQGRRHKNIEQKRKLSAVRTQTRKLLVALLIAAGEQGVTSEEVVAALCGIGTDDSNELPVTQHRVMGMLSAFSRRQEAEMIGSNRWRATSNLSSI